MAGLSQDVSTVPRWQRRRGFARYREFVFFSILLSSVVLVSATERLSPSDVAERGEFIDTPSPEWIVLWTSALLAELTVLYAAAKALVYIGRDRRQARTRALLTLGAALLLLLTFWALWPREHIYTRVGFNGYTGPPLLEFLVAESYAERRLKALGSPEGGVDPWTVFRAFAERGGEPYPAGFRQFGRHNEFRLIRGGPAPLDVSVQVAATPDDVFRSPSDFYYRACQGVLRDTAPAVVTRLNVSVLVRSSCPQGAVSEAGIPAEIALVKDALDSLPN